MTSERKKGEFRKGDVFYLDRHFKLKDIEAAIATKVYAQALADVDAAAEELLGEGFVQGASDGWFFQDSHGAESVRQGTFTEAILSTGGE